MSRENLPSEFIDRDKLEQEMQKKDVELEASKKRDIKKFRKTLDEQFKLLDDQKLAEEAEELNKKLHGSKPN